MAKKDSNEISPMMKYYLNLKEQYADSVLLFRLGDFYECFFEDAKIVSKALDIVLTGRDYGVEGERAPMCGVPAHALDSYLSRLVQQGFKVAICEQLSKPVKGALVKRDVVRVVSSGTVIEDDILSSTKSNFLLSIYVDDKNPNLGAIAYSDISTGEFYCINISSERLIQRINDELVRINPAEIICNRSAHLVTSNLAITSAGIIPKLQVQDNWFFDSINSQNQIKRCFGIDNFKGHDFAENKENICAIGSVLEYFKQTQKRELKHLKVPKLIRDNLHMYIDASTLRNLELVSRMRDGKTKGTLLNVLDYTKTSFGARKLKSIITQPLQNKVQIQSRLEAVDELVKEPTIRLGLLTVLEKFSDIERICSKITYNTMLPKDCNALRTSLEQVPKLKHLLENANSNLLQEINSRLLDTSKICDLIFRTIKEDAPSTMKDGGYIKDGFNEALDEYRNINKNGTDWILNLQKIEMEETGIKNLKIKYNKVFGYFLEVPNSMIEKVPLRYIRKQTTANAERYITEELKEYEDKILNSQEKMLELESEIYSYVRTKLLENIAIIQEVGSAVADLDVFTSFAVASEKNGYVKPQILDANKELNLKECRHPVVEKIISGTSFVANDAILNDEQRIMIITGPNMAGKSTYMREVAISVLMAHIGCFVPCSHAEIPITDRIFTRVGASDDLSFGQSTFMVEMLECANILNNATENSLIVLDEVGRGTSTYDGLSIAWAIMEYLSTNLKAKTLFATHYFELTQLEGVLNGVKNYRISVKEFNDKVIFLRKIVRGGANKSFGIHVASLAGIPKQVTDNAKEILLKLESKQQLDLVNSVGAENFGLQNGNSNETKSKAELILSELKGINVNEITPLKALEILTDVIERIE